MSTKPGQRQAPASSDALVFFGATGDLAHKKIFPALQAMVRRGHLTVPVIGVAKAGWDLDQPRARARDSLENHLLQVAVTLAMDAPSGGHPETLRDEKARVFEAIAPVDPKNVRGQLHGYRDELGVAADSHVETCE